MFNKPASGTEVAQISVTKFKTINALLNLFTPKVATKLELLFYKLASEAVLLNI